MNKISIFQPAFTKGCKFAVKKIKIFTHWVERQFAPKSWNHTHRRFRHLDLAICGVSTIYIPTSFVLLSMSVHAADVYRDGLLNDTTTSPFSQKLFFHLFMDTMVVNWHWNFQKPKCLCWVVGGREVLYSCLTDALVEPLAKYSHCKCEVGILSPHFWGSSVNRVDIVSCL